MRYLLFGTILALLLLAGCTGTEKAVLYQELAKSQPQIQEFLQTYPNSTVTVVYLDETAFSQEMEKFETDCQRQFEIKPYYKVIMKAEDIDAFTLIDETSEKVVCAVIHSKVEIPERPADLPIQPGGVATPEPAAVPEPSPTPAPEPSPQPSPAITPTPIPVQPSVPVNIPDQPGGVATPEPAAVPEPSPAATPEPVYPQPSPAATPTPIPIAPSAALPTITLDGGSLPAQGQTTAPVTLIEFGDFQCPYCARHYALTEPSIRQDYIDTGKVKFYYRDYPLPFHQNADDAALAARCANDQGKFWEYHDKLFDKRHDGSYNVLEGWSNLDSNQITETLADYAGELALDAAAFETCLASRQHENAISEDIVDGQTAYRGELGTPTFFILIPKDRTTNEQLEAALGRGQYTQYMELAQTDREYVVQIAGAVPYSDFKEVLDTVQSQ